MRDFQFTFERPPPTPTATSTIDEVFAWCVWKAMQLRVNDLVFEESKKGLTASCIVYSKLAVRKGEHREMARFPHLRGTPLKSLPEKGSGVAVANNVTWSVRVWTCYRMAGNEFRSCAIVRLLPPPPA
jgi:hypothetical protein